MITSGRQIGLRIAICASAAFLLLQAIWILLPEICRRGAAGYGNSGTTGASSTANEWAARLAVVRGDLWTELALNKRELAWPKQGTNPASTTRTELEAALSIAGRALRHSPHESEVWL